MCACVLLSCINHTTAAAAPVTGWLAQFCAGLLLFGHWRCCCVCCWHGGTTRCIKRLWPCVMAQASAGSAGCLSPWRHAYRCSWLNVCIILYVSSTRRRAAALRVLAHLLLLTTWLCALLVRQHSQLYSLRSRGSFCCSSCCNAATAGCSSYSAGVVAAVRCARIRSSTHGGCHRSFWHLARQSTGGVGLSDSGRSLCGAGWVQDPGRCKLLSFAGWGSELDALLAARLSPPAAWLQQLCINHSLHSSRVSCP